MSIHLVNLVDGADVRMVQGRCGLSLSLETAECLGVPGGILGKELQRDEAIEFDVLGLVDDTHTTATEFFQDAVMREGPAKDGKGIRHFVCILRLSPDNCREQ